MSHSRPSKRRKTNATTRGDEQLFSLDQPSLRKSRRKNVDAEAETEAEYERVPRKIKDGASGRLLVKEHNDWIEAAKDDRDELDSISEQSDGSDSRKQDQPPPVTIASQALPQVAHKQQIIQAKEELAKLASLINENPEEHVGGLKGLAQLAESTNITVKQLAIATQCAVYRDIIPGYRIRPISEGESKEKVSKEVQRQRHFEQALISGYQTYIREIAKYANTKLNDDKATDALSLTAVTCASALLLSVPHFNFRSDIVQIVVGALGRRPNSSNFQTAISTLEKLFDDDTDGRPSLDSVGLIVKLIKARDYNVDERVLNTLLHLRLLREFSHRASDTRVDQDDADLPKHPKQRKQAKQHRSKKQRKLIKEQKELEKEMQAADAVVSYEERDKLQAEMLKLVFATYFRILKAKIDHLMGAVLEGLAKYAHLINQDFFVDILQALKELMQTDNNNENNEQDEQDEQDDHNEQDEQGRDSIRESLLCIITASVLLQGQDGHAASKNLHLDLSFFITYLYRILLPTIMDANIEFSLTKSMHLPDPNLPTPVAANVNVNIKTKTVLLIRSLASTLLPAHALRSVPRLRLAAFTKQMMTCALQLPEKSGQAMLGLLAQTAKVHGRPIAALWMTDERRADGLFDPLRGDVEGSNPFSTTVWEGELLRLHFSPKIREALKVVETCIRTATATSV